jgi:hypothetical protein
MRQTLQGSGIRRRITLISIFISFLLSSSILPSEAAEQIPPSTNVSCSVTVEGVRCGNSIVITQNWSISGTVHTEWYISTLVRGADATNPLNYIGRSLLRISSYVAGSEDFSYEVLLAAVGNDQNAAVLISAVLFNSEGQGSPILGKTVSFTLTELKTLMSEAAAADKAAADKAAADKAAADKAAADKAAASITEAAKVAALAEQVRAIAAKVGGTKAVTSITCVKGKITKKITGKKPACPSGYKKK